MSFDIAVVANKQPLLHQPPNTYSLWHSRITLRCHEKLFNLGARLVRL